MDENRLNKKGPQIGLNIGASSILVVFILLCLVTFSVLSLVSANADLKLSKRVAEHTREYYDATSEAEEILAAKALETRNMDEMADYTVRVNDNQNIHVIARLPATGSGDSINIMSWMLENTTIWEANNDVDLIETNDMFLDY